MIRVFGGSFSILSVFFEHSASVPWKFTKMEAGYLSQGEKLQKVYYWEEPHSRIVDFELLSSEHAFRVHKVVLMSRSNFFSLFFERNPNTGQLTTDYSSQIIRAVLDVIYGHRVHVKVERADDFFKAVEQFQIPIWVKFDMPQDQESTTDSSRTGTATPDVSERSDISAASGQSSSSGTSSSRQSGDGMSHSYMQKAN